MYQQILSEVKEQKTHITYFCRIKLATDSSQYEVNGLKSLDARKIKFQLIVYDEFMLSIENIKGVVSLDPSVENENRKTVLKILISCGYE